MLAGCHSGGDGESNSANSPSGTTTRQVALSDESIEVVDESTLVLNAPGITETNAASVTDLSSNFGTVKVDPNTATVVFQPYGAPQTSPFSDQTSPSVQRQASDHNYQFELHYQVDGVHYQITGFALPLFTTPQNEVVTRFTKLNHEGATLPPEQQTLTKKTSDWSCITDASTALTWQVLQASGDFAFDASYYWGDRTLNHRDFGRALCSLGGDCNTDTLIDTANQQQLCGFSDWRLPSRNEWRSIITDPMSDKDKYLAPIDRFFFPYMNANYDEAYWTSSFSMYPDGHDINPIDGDWQGSNSTVGDAHVIWMSDSSDIERSPPRPTNEPRLSLLVRGQVIADNAPASLPQIAVPMPAETNENGNEDQQWQQRFVKHGHSGQPLLDQSVTQWSCTQDTFFDQLIPNTHILWQRVANTEPVMNYAQALAYVETINQQTLCGRNDWRLPTEKELSSIWIDTLAFGQAGMAYRAGYVHSIFNDTVVHEDSYYWTQTPGQYQPQAKHIAVAFQEEWSASSSQHNTQPFRVRLISTSRDPS
ncbi:DUF1566 domain-containing protein [Vibrio ostreicida]|nr:DUF1566 domain-containing protein [Vibrio ostreicida]